MRKVRRTEVMQEGQLTVFACWMLLLILGVIGAFLEAARYSGARMMTAAASDCAADSVFSEYDRQLLEKYELFFLDGAYGELDFALDKISDRMGLYASYFVEPAKQIPLVNTDLWRLDLTNTRMEAYTLATDDSGRALRLQAAAYMKGRLGAGLLEQIKQLVTGSPDVQELEIDLESREAQNARELEQAQNASQEDGERHVDDGEEQDMLPPEMSSSEQEWWQEQNPITLIQEIKEKGVLGVVMPGKTLSDRETVTALLPSNRQLQKGTEPVSAAGESLTEKLLCNEYFLEKFVNAATAPSGENPLQGCLVYQVEYLLEGKAADQENLRAVVHKLLLLREAVNFVCLLTDQTRQAEAEAVAWAIAGATAVVPLVKAVKYGIILAWAYGESLLDVRTLLAGEKVPAVKNAENWQLSLENISALLEGTAKTAQEEETGALSYQDYLRILLWLEQDEVLTMRAWDLIEMDMQHTAGHECFMADHLIARAKLRFTYEMRPLFTRILPARGAFGNRELKWTVPFSYEEE